jgi:hypothetical protein
MASEEAVWTPGPVFHLQSGTTKDPHFTTVYGLYIGGKVCMIRFSNDIARGKDIVVDSMGCTPKLPV